jgi:hypothetical protein
MTCVCCSTGLADDPDLEPTCGVEDGYPSMPDECEPPDDAEPSLGSFVVNQENSYRQLGWWFPGCDLERDDCDRDDDDGEAEVA